MASTVPAAAEATPDIVSYTQVTIIKTDEIGGHLYRRGTRHYADAPTLAALTAAGIIDAVRSTTTAVQG